MALGFANAGADIIVASRKIEACEETAEEIRHRSRRRALAMACHVGRWEDCGALVDRAYQEFDHVDVLVNNAGMSPLYSSLEDVSEELFDKVVAVNLKGPFRLGALFGTRMVKANYGSIINISTLAVIRPSPDEIPYAAAKAGIETMTLGMARAFAPAVRVNCIMPGIFLTDVSKAWDKDLLDRQSKHLIALRRGGEPTEIVGAALYLASDAASYTTGSVLRVDGGCALAPQL